MTKVYETRFLFCFVWSMHCQIPIVTLPPTITFWFYFDEFPTFLLAQLTNETVFLSTATPDDKTHIFIARKFWFDIYCLIFKTTRLAHFQSTVWRVLTWKRTALCSAWALIDHMSSRTNCFLLQSVKKRPN